MMQVMMKKKILCIFFSSPSFVRGLNVEDGDVL